MKIYELIKNRSEFMWKDRFEIQPGCTYHQDNPDLECIALYKSSEIALEELKRYHTDISKLSGGAGTFYSVTEYYVQVSEYDADGNWLSTEIYDFSDIGIALVDESSHDEVAFFDNLQDAEQALRDYDGEAFLSLNDFPETEMKLTMQEEAAVRMAAKLEIKTPGAGKKYLESWIAKEIERRKKYALPESTEKKIYDAMRNKYQQLMINPEQVLQAPARSCSR